MKARLNIYLNPIIPVERPTDSYWQSPSFVSKLNFLPWSERSSNLQLHKFTKVNSIPLNHVPRRHLKAVSLPVFQKVDLKKRRLEIGHKLRTFNSSRKCQIDQIRRRETRDREQPTEKTGDNFLKNYSEKDHKFTHELIGTIHFSAFCSSPAVSYFKQNHSLLSKETEQLRLTKAPLSFLDSRKCVKSDKGWRALSAVKHLIQLQLPVSLIPKLRMLVPQRPFQLPHAYDFLMACKEGDLLSVRAFISKNRWIALEYDSVKQTGLHWAAKRAHKELVQMLIDAGTYIDAKDSVGQTALYQATRKGHVDIVRVLLSHKANPFLTTNSKRTVLQAASANFTIQRMVMKSMLLYILLKFVPKTGREAVWKKEGVDYFHAKSEVIRNSL